MHGPVRGTRASSVPGEATASTRPIPIPPAALPFSGAACAAPAVDVVRQMRAGIAKLGLGWLLSAACFSAIGSARAEPGGAAASAGTAVSAGTAASARADAHEPSASPEPEPVAEELRRLSAPARPYGRILATIAFGEGVRFNNPYRLRTQLGSDAESLSLTSGYLDLGIAGTLGPPRGVQHGAAVHASFALAGVAQQILTPGYSILIRPAPRVLGYGRLGPAIILSPDANVGGELAFGGGVFLTGRLAVAGEIVSDLFYGAGTRTARYTTYPILSAQLGLLVDYEVLP